MNNFPDLRADGKTTEEQLKQLIEYVRMLSEQLDFLITDIEKRLGS